MPLLLQSSDRLTRLGFRILVLAGLTLLAGTHAGSQAPDPTAGVVVRVMSYNIHHGEGLDGKLDLARIAHVISAADADVVALQEVDRIVQRSGAVDQPNELARQTNMQVVFGDNIALQGGHYGNAILSRLPILTHTNHLLPRINRGEQRGVIDAQVRVGRICLRLLATHFDHRRDDAERMSSALKINRLLSSNGRLGGVRREQPTVLAGDLNATRNSRVLQAFRSLWRIAGTAEQPTAPADKPARQIDFVLAYPANRWKVIDTYVIDQPVASDHRPIVATLQLDEPPGTDDPEIPRFADVRQTIGPTGETLLATNGNQWDARRSLILQAMQSVMGFLPDSTPRRAPAYNVVETVDCGTYTRQLITYESQPGCDTPAYLCIPKHSPDKPIAARATPAVLCLHPTDNQVGHGVVVGLGDKPNRQYASELAARGYVTLAPSYPLLANYQPDLRQLGWESGTLKAVWDNLRGIDLLQSLPMVKQDSIGAIGHSLGGHNSIYTAVFDQRIKAVVTSCGFDSYEDYYDGDPAVWQTGKGWTQLRYMPRLADYRGRLDQIPFDFDELLAAIAPRHVLAIAPLHDSNFRATSVDRMAATASKVFRLLGVSSRLQVVHPDCGHDFPSEMRQTAYELFDHTIGPGTSIDHATTN